MSGQISVEWFPTEVVENTEIQMNVVITAIGGAVMQPAFGISSNSGIAPQFFVGGNWKTLTTTEWEVLGPFSDSIGEGGTLTVTGIRLRFPEVVGDSASALDFTAGDYDSGSFAKSGSMVTKYTTVKDVTQLDYTKYYLAAAAAAVVGAISIVGYAIYRRKK